MSSRLRLAPAPMGLWVCRFFNALAFLTRIPCPPWVVYAPHYQREAACFAPAVGWIVGACAALVFAAAVLVVPLPVAVVLSMLSSVWLTGALHEDGFSDVCDGFGGGWNAEQIKAIMKDSRIGTFGAMGLILLFFLKFMLLWEIAQRLPALAVGLALICGHSLSRLAAVSLIYTQTYVGSGQGSKSSFMASPMSAGALGFAAGCALAPLALFALLTGPIKVLAVIPAWLARVYLGRLFTRRLGGYTGDCLGCVQQVSEVAFYLAVCALV